MGVSGSIGTNSRAGWYALNARLAAGDTLVVAAIDRIGRRWMNTVNVVRDLRVRGVKIKSLSVAEASWASCLAADPGTPSIGGFGFKGHIRWTTTEHLAARPRLRVRPGLIHFAMFWEHGTILKTLNWKELT